MALIRRIDIVEYKEITVEYPVPDANFGIRIDDFIYINSDLLNKNERRVSLLNYGIYGWSDAKSSSGITIEKNTNDFDNDGISDYLDVDVENDGIIDGNGDFSGVVKRTFLLGKVRLWDSADDGTRGIDQLYQEVRTNKNFKINEDSVDLDGWLILGESKSSYYYERCLTTINGKTYSGRLPVSKNYFDIKDLWIRKTPNDRWIFVSGQGENPLDVVFELDIFSNNYTRFSSLITTGFDWSIGPKLSDWPFPVKWLDVQEYFLINNIVNKSGTFFLPVTYIKSDIKPVNLMSADRSNAVPNSSYYSIISTENSQKAFFSNTFNSPLYELVEQYYSYNSIPSSIPFDDGAKDRFGVPRFAIQQGFSVNNQKFYGQCVPIPDEKLFEEESGQSDGTNERDYRTRVSIADVLSGRVKLDGTNYVRGVITAHFTFPLKSIQNSDIDNLHWNMISQPDIYNTSTTYLNDKFPDIYTFAREMRNVIYLQDETAGMELLGTDFYSRGGLEYKGLPESAQLNGLIFTAQTSPPEPNLSIAGYNTVYQERIDISDLEFLGSRGVRLPRVSRTLEVIGRDYPEADVVETRLNINANLPVTSYWETDTGYVAENRYHFKVGDFIEIYNLDILKRPYGIRTCKVVNGEYRIIPNLAEDIDKYFEDNVIQDVYLVDLRKDPGNQNPDQRFNVSNYAEWISYDYTDSRQVGFNTIRSPHRFENCLVRVKNVAFALGDRNDQPTKIFYNSYSRLMENDEGPFEDSDSIDSQTYWGYRFEPCARVMIRDVSNGDFEFGNKNQKGWVYIPCSTEMGEHMLKIPGRPIQFKDENSINSQKTQEYVKWKTTKMESGNFVDFDNSYQWPLTIVGIQKRSLPTDITVYGGDFYEIWPRRYQDVGVSIPKKDIKVSQDKDKKTSDRRGSGSGGSTSTDISNTCFPHYVNVKTPSGWTPIIDLEIGQLVVTFDDNGNLYDRPIIRKYVHDGTEKSDIYRYFLSNSTVLDITDNHPVLTKNGFIPIGNLKIGDGLLGINNEEIFIESKLFLKNDTVYNIEVDEYNAYIAEGIRVHNLTKKISNDRLKDILDDLDEAVKDARDGMIGG